jgi:hypothetical protein
MCPCAGHEGILWEQSNSSTRSSDTYAKFIYFYTVTTDEA